MKYSILSICIFISILCHATPHRFIDTIDLTQHSITYRVNKEFHATYLRNDFYVTYQDDIDLFNLDYTIITMPLIMNTIAMIWVSGNDYTIDAMDKDLYASLSIVKEIFKRFYPITSFNGNLIPRKLVDNTGIWKTIKKAKGFALPFSHGLDSLCTSIRHHTTPQLLITARGMPDTPLDMWDTNWEHTKNTIAHFAQIHGHTTTYITSNFHEFLNWKRLCTFSPEIQHWRLCLVEGLGWMGLAAPILISKGYKSFVLPANGDWSSPHPGADCPLINDNVHFAGITNISDGFEIPREHKNEIIVNICNEHHLEKPPFIICEKILTKRENCCTCYKCVSSILALLLLDENPQEYGFTIDLSAFLHFFKTTFIQENALEPDTARAFKYYQQQAREKLTKLPPLLQAFFEWYVTLDFDASIVEWNNIVIDYNDFIDVYPHIPQEILGKKPILKNSMLLE